MSISTLWSQVLQWYRRSPILWLSISLFLFTLSIHGWYAFNFLAFSQDQGRDAYLMHQWVDQGKFILSYGPKASVGDFYLAPFYYQLHLILSVLTNHYPLVMHVLITVLESVTPVLLFLILRRWVNTQAAGFASLLYGIAVLPLTFTTFAWNPNLIPFCSTLALWAWLKYLYDKKRWAVVVGFLAVTIACHLHYQSAVLLPFTFLVFLYSVIKDRVVWKWWVLALGLAFLTMAPYFYAELRSNWINTQAILHYFTQEHSQYYDRVSKAMFVWSFIPSFTERAFIGDQTQKFWLGRVLLFGGLVVAVGYVLKAKSKSKVTWWLLYWGSLLFTLRFYRGDKLDYYLSTLFITPAVWLAFIWHRSKWAGATLALIITYFAVTHIAIQPPQNNWLYLQQTMKALEEVVPQSKVAVTFEEAQFVNRYAYGLSYVGKFEIDQTSTTVLSICPTSSHCFGKRPPVCTQNRLITMAALLTTDRNYRNRVLYRIGPDIKIAVAEVDPLPQPITYSLNDTRYGNDFVLP